MKNYYTHSKSILFVVLLSVIGISCEKEDIEELESTTNENLETNVSKFDFEHFGKTHNAYLEYVYRMDDRDNAEARFEYGKTFQDPIFGSFDIGLKFQDILRARPNHLKRTEEILNGTYQAAQEGLSPKMTEFLNTLAYKARNASQSEATLEVFQDELDDFAITIKRNNQVSINLASGVSNDGAAMLAMVSILKHSTAYWLQFGNGGAGDDDVQLKLGNGKIKRALADAWGYVSAWVNNGDGSYSWDHESALVNADCVSDSVRSN